MSVFCRLLLILGYLFVSEIVSAKALLPSDAPFPIAYQSKNACYFNSVNIALEAKYKIKLRLKKVLGLIQFDGKSLATWEYKTRFANLTHIQVTEYRSKKDLIRLLDIGEPVLVSTEILLKTKKMIRHVSVAYSYDDRGIWVSDPLDGKHKRIEWESVFQKNGSVKYTALRTIKMKPYIEWSTTVKEQEKKQDIWITQTK